MTTEGNAAIGIHGDGGIAARSPQPHPLDVGGPASAMHQHHAGHFLIAFAGGNPDVGKNAGHFAFIGQPLIKKRFHAFLLESGSRKGGRCLGKGRDIPLDFELGRGDGCYRDRIRRSLRYHRNFGCMSTADGATK
nr:hypothetical protein [uncultured bacterium]